MKHLFAAAALAAAVCAGGVQAQPRAAANVQTITPEGLGPVRIGMTAQVALRALGRGWRLEDPLEPGDANGCRYIGNGHPETTSVSYMVENMRVTRIETGAPESGPAAPIASERGIRVGATEADVRRAYPRGLVSEAHAYEERPAAYLTYWTRGAPRRAGGDPAADARGIRFVTDNHRRVTAILAGGPSIQYIEGCA